MFCSNCGSKLPDGSRFCSVCGTRLADVEPAGKEVTAFTGSTKPEIVENDSNSNRAGKISFDWSNVIEEPVKRTTPNVRSPWDEVQVEQRPSVDKPSVDHRRTMSFIEILKQEREEKLQAAEREAQAVIEREEATPDYSAFNDAPSIYEPKAYEETAKVVEEPVKEFSFAQMDKAQSYEESQFEEPVFEEPKFDEPEYEAPTFEEPKYEEYFAIESDFEAPLAEESDVAEPVEFDVPSYKDDSEILVSDAVEFKEDGAESDNRVPVYSEVATNVEDLYGEDSIIADADPTNLEAELDAILASSMGRVSRMERNAAYDTANVDPVAEPAVDIFETAVEEVQPEISLEEQIAADTREPVNPMKSTIAPPAENESEIAELKRRLAELMGAPEEPTDLTKETPKVEDFVAGGFETAVDITKTEDPEILSAVAPVAVGTTTETTVVDDAMSLEDLEKDLFGDAEPESIEAEATKKIDKFYTLYKKNEEFQRLLDEEYNKLKEEDDANATEPVVVPVVEKLEEPIPLTVQPATEPVPVQKVEPVPVEKAEPVPVEKAEATPVMEAVAPVAAPVAETTLSKKEEKAAAKQARKATKAAAKQAKADSDYSDDDEEGGGALTVIAVIVAFLLVILLGVILVLNFAPDSGIAMAVDSIIENIASYFSATDAIKGVLL